VNRPFDASHRFGRLEFSNVFQSTILVPGTQTFCENRPRPNDGRQNGLKGSASKERFLTACPSLVKYVLGGRTLTSHIEK
jgi:hypothetical protein